MSLKNQLKEKIAKNQFKAVFEQLKQQLSTSSSDLNIVINLQGQFSDAEKGQLQGMLSKEDASLIMNRIRDALLHIIDELPENLESAKDKTGTGNVSELEVSGWNTQVNLLVKKINRIRQALILEDDPGRQFKYEQQIEQLEVQLQQLKDRLNQA